MRLASVALLGIMFLGGSNGTICQQLAGQDMTLAARSGCCSNHGGVCGCDKAKQKLRCCDGRLSPSCGC